MQRTRTSLALRERAAPGRNVSAGVGHTAHAVSAATLGRRNAKRGRASVKAEASFIRHNTSIERTCHGRLRLPRHAAHVER
jgi:hypothetical protein